MITQTFKQAVEAKDLEHIKIMLRSSLSTDLTFEQFKELLAYTLHRIPNIIEPHDGKEFLPLSQCTKEYASEVREDLMQNFSAERIEHLQDVHEVVYANELRRQIQKQQERMAASNETHTKANTSKIVKTLVMALGVGVASILIGVLMNLSIVQVATAAVITTLIVGGVTYYVVQKR